MIAGTACSFKVFLPPLKLSKKQERKEKPSRPINSHRESPCFDRIFQGLPGIQVFLQVLLATCMKTTFDFEFISSASQSVIS